MARIARTLAAILATITLMAMGASSASACTTSTDTVPVVGMIFVGTDVDGSEAAMISTASDCTATVVVDDTKTPVFRDYATTSDGTVAPVTFCEGEQGPRFLTAYAGDLAAEDGTPYVIGDLV